MTLQMAASMANGINDPNATIGNSTPSLLNFKNCLAKIEDTYVCFGPCNMMY